VKREINPRREEPQGITRSLTTLRREEKSLFCMIPSLFPKDESWLFCMIPSYSPKGGREACWSILPLYTVGREACWSIPVCTQLVGRHAGYVHHSMLVMRVHEAQRGPVSPRMRGGNLQKGHLPGMLEEATLPYPARYHGGHTTRAYTPRYTLPGTPLDPPVCAALLLPDR